MLNDLIGEAVSLNGVPAVIVRWADVEGSERVESCGVIAQIEAPFQSVELPWGTIAICVHTGGGVIRLSEVS